MALFGYIAKDINGKKTTGVIEADDEAVVRNMLHKQNLVIISITPKKKSIFKSTLQKKVKLDEVAIFSRQLATMVSSGIPLAQALSILNEQVENPTLNQALLKMRHQIEEGKNFYETLSYHPKIFSNLYINMAKAGEASGMLHDILERLAGYLEKSIALRRKVVFSLVYPAVVICMAILITIFLLVFVVPKFKSIFDVLGGTLPVPTQILLFISDVVSRYFLAFIIAAAFMVVIFKKYISTEKGRYRLDKIMLNLPIFGIIIRKMAIAKFSRTFSTLVKSGVPILSALDIVGATSGNKIIAEAISNAEESIRQGEAIAQPLAACKVFPPMVVRMVSVGEQTGKLDMMLTKIAEFYEEQVEAAVGGLTSLIEPLVIAFLGTIIGSIVIALFLPILKIIQLVGR